jgi:exo-1,4-beta-D-glucosaminidase
MVGWSCHWEWEDDLGAPCDEEFGGILAPSDVDMMSRAWQDQIVWLRNHPSIFSWVGGSDCKPKPELEQKYFETFAEYDSTRVYLASAKEWESTSGPTGVKMRGPYAYEPPVYWFADTLYGGAFGFNTETGPGAQVPPLESMKRMISEAHLWPMKSMWDYHSGRNEFNSLDRYTTALEARFGKAKDVADYTKKAQLLNYELMRPMFEAFSAYRYEATGVIQWMLNSAWPETFWQLYDYYLMPNGAYYGAKKASQPRHAIYDYARHSIFVVNDKLEDKNACTLKVRTYDFGSALKFEAEVKLDLAANTSVEALQLPAMDWGEPVYFLDMRLLDENGNEMDNNFYWLAAKTDVLDYKAKPPNWYYHTPTKQYADFTALNDLPKVKVSANLTEKRSGEETEFVVELKNDNPQIAFFIHPQIRDEQSGMTILPVLWSDNYVSLLPGESRKLTAKIKNKYLKDKKPHLLVEGYNLTGE